MPEKRLIDATADSCGETTKIKTHHARIVVDGTAEKPYYSIEWFDPTKKEYYLGYSSYFIGNVFEWLEKCFEIVDAPTVDAVEVVHARWENVQNGKGCCSNCHRLDSIDNLATHCRYCGARMDGGMK